MGMNMKHVIDWALDKIGLERKTEELANALGKIEAYQRYVERLGRAASLAGVTVIFDEEVFTGEHNGDIYVVGRYARICDVNLRGGTIFISPGALPFHAQNIIGLPRPILDENLTHQSAHHICDIRTTNNWESNKDGDQP